MFSGISVKTRIVFDSNVYIAAAAAAASHSMKWIRSAGKDDRSYDLYVSEPLIAEVTAKLLSKFKLPMEVVATFTNQILTVATLVKPTEHVQEVDRDPDDDKILECAVAAKAHLIITADRDLLQFRKYRDISIYHPSNLKYFFPNDIDRTP